MKRASDLGIRALVIKQVINLYFKIPFPWKSSSGVRGCALRFAVKYCVRKAQIQVRWDWSYIWVK